MPIPRPKWKDTPSLKNAVRKGNKKDLDYYNTYVKEFLQCDPIRDWPSISRCIILWTFCLSKIKNPDVSNWRVLDCGTKDGQFPEYLSSIVAEAIGVEICDKYVQYAKSKGRNVVKGDICNLQFENNSFDFVFAHHVLGLVQDYYKGLSEMFRVTKPGGYMTFLGGIPGSKEKHYEYLDSPDTLHKWIERKEMTPNKTIYSGRWTKKDRSKVIDLSKFNYNGWDDKTEWILLLQKG